jgi:hypothetical protein
LDPAAVPVAGNAVIPAAPVQGWQWNPGLGQVGTLNYPWSKYALR